MPRTRRFIYGGGCYHVINRGNKKARVFHQAADFDQFLAAIYLAQERLEVPILAMCLMPNHFHLVVRPKSDADFGRWTRWLFTAHVRWHHAKYETSGHVWQGRYKAFAIQEDHHLQTVMRYVERNALRANLVERAEDWRWGSLAWRSARQPPVALAKSPISLPPYWRQLVNEPQSEAELEAIRTCVNRQRPFGADEWVTRYAAEHGVEHSLKPPGRPRRKRSAAAS
ncbi:MAG TPA: transposase [Steroidobacteraceae bacterium]|nr:transposase [Steroidobacteraceae bacterium]